MKEGDRVGVPWLYTACGTCKHCLGAWETLCESQLNTGYSINGGFTECVVADPNYVGHLPATSTSLKSPPCSASLPTCVPERSASGDFPLSIFGMVLNGITVRGSIVGTRLDLQDSLDFAGEGKVKATVSPAWLEDINNVFARMHAGKIDGRVVLDLSR